jgi:nitrogen fixation protein FixH
MTARAQPGFELKGWHVLILVVGFFAAVTAIDVGMAVQAYRTFPGEVSATPYEDGLKFNSTLAERAEERSLGWRASVKATVLGAGGTINSGRTQLLVTISDKTGQPVRGLELKGRLERPATESGRRQLSFVETRPGLYQAFAPDSPGAWDLTISGADTAGRPFEAESRMTWR